MSEASRPRRHTDDVTDDVDEVFSHANPNPSRVGCPPKNTLVALAEKALSLDHPAYEHLTKCSPCYVEFRSLQNSMTATDSRRSSSG